MTVLFFLSFFVASMLVLTSFLQAESRWWAGLLGALALFVLGVAVFVFVPQPEEGSFLAPAGFLGLGALVCSVIIGAGSVAALVMRRIWSPGQVAGIVFLGGWLLTFLWFSARAFT